MSRFDYIFQGFLTLINCKILFISSISPLFLFQKERSISEISAEVCPVTPLILALGKLHGMYNHA